VQFPAGRCSKHRYNVQFTLKASDSIAGDPRPRKPARKIIPDPEGVEPLRPLQGRNEKSASDPWAEAHAYWVHPYGDGSSLRDEPSFRIPWYKRSMTCLNQPVATRRRL